MKFNQIWNGMMSAVKNQLFALNYQIKQNHQKNFIFTVFWLMIITLKLSPKFAEHIGDKDTAALLILAATFIYNMGNSLFLFCAAISVLLVPFTVATNHLVLANLFSAFTILFLVIALFIVPLKNYFYQKFGIK